MKWYSGILLFVMAAWMLASCGSRADRPSLVAADSLILHDPDSACAVLEAYPADSLTADGDRAYHALLTTIARYKAYRPATTDSLINIAVGHYDRSGADPDRRMRSLLYKGCVMEELGDPEQAIENYKRAETACPDNDYFHTGYINMRMASLYQSAYSDSLPITIYKVAIGNFRKAHDKHYEAQCMNSLGVLCAMDKPEIAVKYIYKSISLAAEIGDSLTIGDGYNALCYLNYNKENYREVANLAYKTLVTYRACVSNRSCNDFVAISFSKLGLIDSAEKYLEMAPPATSTEDSITWRRALSEIARARGNLNDYAWDYEWAVNKADSLILADQADKIREAEAKYDMATKELKHLTRQKHMATVIAVLLAVMIAVIYSVLVYRRRAKIAQIELEHAVIQLAASQQQVGILLGESKERLEQLRLQEAQLIELQGVISKKQTGSRQPTDEVTLHRQIASVNEMLIKAQNEVAIQEKTRFCVDQILHTVFYSGKRHSDRVIDNDSPIIMNQMFWDVLTEVATEKFKDIYHQIEECGIRLSESEQKLLALHAAQIPNAIIRRILGYKSVQTISNLKHKLAKKLECKDIQILDVF